MVTAPGFTTFFPSFAYGLAYHLQNNDIKFLCIAFYRGFLGEKPPRPEAGALHRVAARARRSRAHIRWRYRLGLQLGQ